MNMDVLTFVAQCRTKETQKIGGAYFCKKIGLSLVALAFALVIPFSSAYAGGGEWDRYPGNYPYGYKLYYNSSYGYYNTAAVCSHGGDFMIEVYGSNADDGVYELMESDPGPGNDDFVGQVYLFPGDGSGTRDDYAFRNIGGYVDGSNGCAEFYVKAFNGGKLNFWD
jgi:hypothetical protein